MKKSISIILVLNLYIFISYFDTFNVFSTKNYYKSNSHLHLYDTANLSAKIKDHLHKAFKEIKKNEQRNLENPVHPLCRNSIRKPVDKKIDPTILKLAIKPKSLCSKKAVDLFIYIFSRVASGSIRSAIRNTWGNKNRKLFKHLKLVFIVGQSENDHFNKLVHLEAKQHQDIIQTNLPVVYLAFYS